MWVTCLFLPKEVYWLAAAFVCFRILDVWKRVYNETLPPEALAGIEAVMVSRLRGEAPDLVDALSAAGSFQWDSSWLGFEVPPKEAFEPFEGQWFVEGEGGAEQRRYFYAFLTESAEILWTNGAGVKLGLQTWTDFQAALEKEQIRPLPKLTPFGTELAETVELLAGVCDKQRRQREQRRAWKGGTQGQQAAVTGGGQNVEYQIRHRHCAAGALRPART